MTITYQHIVVELPVHLDKTFRIITVIVNTFLYSYNSVNVYFGVMTPCGSIMASERFIGVRSRERAGYSVGSLRSTHMF